VSYTKTAEEIGELVEKKNEAYGNSFAKSEEMLKILYPDGIPEDSYEDVLLLAPHEKKKFELCWKLEQENKKYICEARFNDRDLRADIYVLDDDELLEIESSEYELQDRKNQYPESKTWVYPLWNEEREVIRLSNHYK